ncbi:hypothetical protein [Leekyejoonella antrihumi]|uniref:Uncharacterized protein n=1 Tax=Leekyejoonella antrihumi TaxID=1660198 RepID=A0A563DW99_9MICO|nr:hypothetical protein [Leekyejoonella antrihumi]TWP34558.1 hypothetical protein FGL98_16820 [Leekyejoonella antrihumi]
MVTASVMTGPVVDDRQLLPDSGLGDLANVPVCRLSGSKSTDQPWASPTALICSGDRSVAARLSAR